MNISPLLQTDFYKVNHHNMYPDDTTKIYSNLTPRKSRLPGIDKIVVFGIQYFVMEYLMKQWDDNFFNKPPHIVLKQYKRMVDSTLGKDAVSTKHLEDLWNLGYMPLHIKALPEGTLCPIGVPCLTITNTVDHAYWLVNYLETILSCTVWQPITSATIAYEYKKLLSKYAFETAGSADFVPWQGHDFSMRGMSSLESACTSGAGHLLSFTGTDTIPAISFLEQYYGTDVEKELVGASVPATEHSVMCMGTKNDEIGTFRTLLQKYPSGILSVVSDTWDLWKVCTDYIIQLKSEILARDGKLVIRPDSGDPVDIICGIPDHYLMPNKPGGYNENWYKYAQNYHYKEECVPEGKSRWFSIDRNERKGVIELLWDAFGGTVNEQGYKVLDPHIGAIYGDSITLQRAEEICERLKAKGFASTNIVFGIGSYTYQMNTRDTFGFAVKATYGEVLERYQEGTTPENLQWVEKSVGREIFKDPITDDGTKKSAKGLLQVYNGIGDPEAGEDEYKLLFDGTDDIKLKDQVTKEQEAYGLLENVFLNGKLMRTEKLSTIRQRLTSQLPSYATKVTDLASVV